MVTTYNCRDTSSKHFTKCFFNWRPNGILHTMEMVESFDSKRYRWANHLKRQRSQGLSSVELPLKLVFSLLFPLETLQCVYLTPSIQSIVFTITIKKSENLLLIRVEKLLILLDCQIDNTKHLQTFRLYRGKVDGGSSTISLNLSRSPSISFDLPRSLVISLPLFRFERLKLRDSQTIHKCLPKIYWFFINFVCQINLLQVTLSKLLWVSYFR